MTYRLPLPVRFRKVIIAAMLAGALDVSHGKGDENGVHILTNSCLLYTSPSPRDRG